MFRNDINVLKKNHLSDPSEYMQPLEQTCYSLTRALRGNMAGMGTSRACGSEKEAAACQSVVIQVHTPRHLCQLMRETQLCFI